MSRYSKRTWNQQAGNGEKEHTENMASNSRTSSRESSESSTNRKKKSKPNQDLKKPKKVVELETNQDLLLRRQKQIDYGKNTVGYTRYTQQIPEDQRSKEHPKTPDKYIKYSRRSWDMLIKIWRKKLHEFDDTVDNGKEENKEDNEMLDDDDDKLIDEPDN